MKDIFKSEYKNKLVKIFVPIMLSNLISQIQMFIDRIFLGRMNILYMSAVGNTTAPVWTTMSFIFSLSMGASILISQSVGEKDLDKAKEYAASLIKMHNVLPVILFLFWFFCSPLVFRLMGVSETVLGLCVTYTRIYSPVFLLTGLFASYSVVFQTSNYTKPLVTYGIIRSVLNIILDYLLIFGNFGFPRLEITGAALGTTIAEFAGAFYLLYIIIAKKDKFFTNPDFKTIIHAKLGPYLKSAKLGLPTACEDLLWNAGNLCIIRILNTINEMAAGIYSMVFTVEILFVVIIGAIGNGTLTLTGEATGAKDHKLYRSIVKTAIKWSFLVSATALVFVSLFPRFTLSLFTTDKEVIEMSVVFIILVAFDLFGKSGNIILGNGIRGYGDTKWMFCTQLLGTFGVVGMAALCVFVFKFGILGVFIAVLCDEASRSLINFVRFLRIKF